MTTFDSAEVARYQFHGQDVSWLLDHRAEHRGDHPFLVWEPRSGDDVTWTYAAFVEQTKAVADCKVDGEGVMELTGSGDGAKAHVIMNLVISQSLAGQAANSGAPAVDLHMVRKGDAWLIEQLDEIRAVS